ncbi:nitroreductase family protein [Zavarzinia sp.]|uniref:nitroreductase family protein n=1 Tax=Zavarzinia sp. TaxID=2027920 RepID=UPI003BB57A0F|nr:nitroreductase family protein [Zavarzinia sp.]
MPLQETILERRTMRDYGSEPLDDATIRDLIRAARQGPGTAPPHRWACTVIRDAAALARISREAKAHMLASLRTSPHSAHYQSLLGDPAFDIFYRAPVLLVISATTRSPWNVEDCTIAAENLMLAASEAGLGACWIGFAQGFIGTAEGKAALGVPADWVPVAPIIVGRADNAALPLQRKPPELCWIG